MHFGGVVGEAFDIQPLSTTQLSSLCSLHSVFMGFGIFVLLSLFWSFTNGPGVRKHKVLECPSPVRDMDAMSIFDTRSTMDHGSGCSSIQAT